MADRGKAKKKKVIAAVEAAQSGEFEALPDSELNRFLDSLPLPKQPDGNGNGNH